MKSQIEDTPNFVFILVYMAVASAEKSSALGGRCRRFRSCMTIAEFFMKDLTKGNSSFILKSSQVEKIPRKLLEPLTTGRRVTGVLWTLGSP